MTDEQLTPEQQEAQQRMDNRYWFMKGVQRNYQGTQKTVFFSEEDIQRSKYDQDFFEHKVIDVVNRYPHLIFEAISNDETRFLFSDEQIVDAVEKSLETRASALIYNFDSIAHLFSPDEQDELLIRACQADDSTYVVLTEGTKPLLARLKDRPEWNDIVTKAIMKSGRGNHFAIEAGLEQEVFSTRSIVDATKKLAEADNTIPEAFSTAAYSPEAFTDQEWRDLQDKAREYFKKKENARAFYSLEAAKNILPPEEIEAITLDYLKSYPEKASYLLDTVESVLGTEAVVSWIKQQLGTPSESQLFGTTTAKDILSKYLHDETTKKVFIDRLLQVSPGNAIEILKEIHALYPPEEVRDIVHHIIAKTSASQVKRFSYDWQNMLQLSDEEMVPIIKDKLSSANLRDFILALDSPMSSQSLFSPEEFFSLIRDKLPAGASDFTWSIKNFTQTVKRLYKGDNTFIPLELPPEAKAEVKKIFDQFYLISRSEWIYSMHDMHEFYDPSEIEERIWQISYDLKAARVAVSSIEKWGNLVGPEKTRQWLEYHAASTAIEQMIAIKQCLSFVPHSEQASYIERLVNLNPAAASYMEKVGQPFASYIKGESAWNRLMALDPKEQALPQLFKEYRDETAKNENIPGVAETMLVRFASYFRNLGSIEQAGMVPAMERIVANSVKGIRQEKACLDLFSSWALLRAGEPLSDNDAQPESLAELENIVFNELTKRLRLNQEITPEQSKKFSDQMGEVSAFATYFVQYENSPEHLSLLQEIFLAIADGKFKEWKFGHSEDLKHLQEQKLLPEKLTAKQYETWQEDDFTDSIESLSVSTEAVAQKIQSTIRNNAEHLYLGDFLSSSASFEEASIIAAEEQQKVGRELAEFNREYGALKKQQPPNEELLAQMAVERVQLEVKRDYLKLVQKLLQLAQVRPEELAIGYFMKGENKTGSIESSIKEISSILQSLSERGVDRDALDTTLLGIISTYIQELKDKGLQSRQRLITTDSSSPKVFLEVGNNPVESCQNYAFGVFNECLLGYSEANVKILIITNEKGNIIARSIFRLLTDQETGDPALHVESIYSTSASDTVTNLIYKHAINKAERMGVKIFVSEKAQNEQGVLIEADLGDQVVTQASTTSLESYNANAPYSYVDSAGGKREKGQYAIDRLYEITFSMEARISQVVENAFTGEGERSAETLSQPEITPVEITDLDTVVEFYNRHFPKSQHSREFKASIYGDESRQPVVLQIKDNGKIVGLLEAWNDKNNPGQKVLATVAVDPGYRRQGYARKLFEEAREIVAQNAEIESWVVHFRDGNKDKLAPMYANLGFEELTEAETLYSNGEIKWEMTMRSEDPWRSQRSENNMSPAYS